MQKCKILMYGLALLLILSIVFSALTLVKLSRIEAENKQLTIDLQKVTDDLQGITNDRDNLRKENSEMLTERGQLKDDIEIYKSKFSMLEQDYNSIKRSCINGDNACRNKLPLMRYKCNVQGDAVDNGDRTCMCDEECKLKYV